MQTATLVFSFALLGSIVACGDPATPMDAGTRDGGTMVDAGARDGGVERDADAPDADAPDADAGRDAATDAAIMPLTCAALERASITGTVGATTYTFREAPRATAVATHLRVEADDLAVTLRRWVVTVPNRVGTHRCGDDAMTQVALIGVDGVVGTGGAASATATEGSCTITVDARAASSGDEITGCFEATLIAREGDTAIERVVTAGAFRARRD